MTSASNIEAGQDSGSLRFESARVPSARRWCDCKAVVWPKCCVSSGGATQRFVWPMCFGLALPSSALFGGWWFSVETSATALRGTMLYIYIYIYMWSFHQFHAPYQRCCYSTKVSAQNCLGSHQVFFWFSRCSLWIPAWWLRATRWAGYLGSTCGVIWVSGCYLLKP